MMKSGIDSLGCKLLLSIKRLWLSPFIVIILLSGSGCQFAPKQPLRWPWSKESEKQQPTRILPVWTDTVLYQTNQPGVRGFGGRVYFYAEDKTEPIEVDGGLAVYVFDADNDTPHDQKPLRKFVFTSEQFAEHMSRTSIGPSYSVWLPWGEVGGPPQRLSLIARFEGAQGGTVISDPTIKLLPGIPAKKQPPEGTASEQPTASKMQLASHATQASGETGQANNTATGSPEPRRSIGTIDLPPSFHRHFLHSPRSGDVSPDTGSSTNNESANEGAGNEDNHSLPTTGIFNAEPNGMTTTVSDARSRNSEVGEASSGYAGGRSKRDIRQGRWITAE